MGWWLSRLLVGSREGPQGVQLEVTRPPLTAHPVFLSLTRHSGGKGDRRGEGRFWVEGRSEVSTTTEPG